MRWFLNEVRIRAEKNGSFSRWFAWSRITAVLNAKTANEAAIRYFRDVYKFWIESMLVTDSQRAMPENSYSSEDKMNILLVIDPDTPNQRAHRFSHADYEIQDVRWESFQSMPERLFTQQDAFVGDSIYPALFLNTLTVAPDMVSMLPDGWLYISVCTLPVVVNHGR